MSLPVPTPAQKKAVWQAIAPPARLTVWQIAAATGLSETVVFEVIALGRAAKRIDIHDQDRTHQWIGQVAA